MTMISQSIKFVSLFTFIYFWQSNLSYSQIISEQRKVNWTYAGKKDIFPNTTDTLNILDFGGNRDSAADNTTPLNMAMQNLAGHEGVIYFPPGKYLFKGAVNMKAGVTIQGSGSEHTFFYFTTSGAIPEDAFIIKNNNISIFQNAIAGYNFGSNYIKVSSAAPFQGASYIEILQDNGTWDTNPANWATNTVGQIIPIDKLSNDTIFLKHPLRLDYTPTLNPRIRPFIPIRHVAFKCFTIQRSDHPNMNLGFFNFINAAECFINGIASIKSEGSHVKINSSTNITISGSYFYDAFEFDGTSTRGYGITLFTITGECLIENNIFRKLRHAISLKQGANGNVLGYNYIREGKRSEFPSDFVADINLHGHYAYANLIEGNIGDNFFTDHTFGPAGPLNTFFRNKADGYGIAIFKSGSQITAAQNYVGNDATGNKPIPFYLLPVIGRSLDLNGADHFSYANRESGNIIPAGTITLTDQSYYLNAQPLFWTEANNWPSIGIPNANSTGSIPSRDRYFLGQLTTCPLFTHDQTTIPSIKINIFKVTRLDDKIALNWDITGQIAKIEIQKSNDSINFQTITASLQEATTIYDKPSNLQWAYYRLKIHDKSGLIFYSDIASVHNANGVVVMPPVFSEGHLIIQITSQTEMPYFIRVYNASGGLKLSQKIQNNFNMIPAINWPTGMWIINIQNNSGFNKTYKVVKP